MVSSDPFALHWSLYPHQYVAPRTIKPLSIDGNINKPEWDAVSWSSPFDEIRGKEDAPPGTRPTENCKTRMKMLWDDEYLYVCAMIESDFEVKANFTKRNEPIFQKDSDFEVFINPSGNCFNYKELELNAINTVWNLMLDKPYDDGGHEHSGRIAKPGDTDYYDVNNQKTATKVVKGKINSPKGATWTVELALAHSDTLAHDDFGIRPVVGGRWRINFSRVEHEGEINWTWQPQRVWDPRTGRFTGKVAMHLPDAWGYVEFAPSDATRTGDTSVDELGLQRRDPSWPARLAAMNLYYAQRRYFEINNHGRYASSIEELKGLVNDEILKPFVVPNRYSYVSISVGDDGKTYSATVGSPNGGEATVTQERLLTVDHINNKDES